MRALRERDDDGRHRISAASTSSMFTAPPTGPTRYRAITPPVIAPNDAPAPMSPKSRRACRVSKSEFAKLHACTGAMMPKQFTQTKKMPGSSLKGENLNAYQKRMTFEAKNSERPDRHQGGSQPGDGAVYSGTNTVSAIGTAAYT